MSQLQLSRALGTLRIQETLRNVIRSIEFCSWNNPIHEHRLGSGWPSSYTVKKNLRVMNAKLNIGQKHVSHKLGKPYIEIVHRQHTSEYLIWDLWGCLVPSFSSSSRMWRKQRVQWKGYHDKQPRANNWWEQVWDLDLVTLVKWRLRGDLTARIPEQQLQRWVEPSGDVTTA